MSHSPPDSSRVRASVIIPAHNEGRSIARLLDQLVTDRGDSRLEILVICNGCTDDTATIARRYEPFVRVIEVAQPSKYGALQRGNDEAGAFPRLYVDSDVEIDLASLVALVDALDAPGSTLLAAAPQRVVPRTGVSLLVRWYYDVWEKLPQVRDAPFGRGVIALSRAGFERIRDLPSVLSDDLAMTAALEPSERVVVPGAWVTVWPPRTVGDLLRRRVRVATGNAQLDHAGVRGEALRTSPRTLAELAWHRPVLVPKVVIFLGVTLASRLSARRRIKDGDFHTWLRDESSRSG